MISEDELRNLISQAESDRLEFTVSTTDTDKFAEAVTAFSNDFPNHRQPGYLVIGVRDSGELSGLTVTHQLLQNLAALRSDGNIQPLPSINVARLALPEGEVAVVEVLPAELPPVRFKGRVYIRVGPRRAVATAQEEAILTAKRVASARAFDALPCLGSSVADLALDLFRVTYLPQAVSAEVLAENHRPIEAQLASLRFFDLGKSCPTNACILLFGKNPLQWLPGAYIQYLEMAGDSLTAEVLQDRQVSGDLLTVLRELESLIQNIVRTTPQTLSTLRESNLSNYPPLALRELVLNAVLHRNYESTAPIRFYRFHSYLEIQSPGGLYGEASPENFPNQNSYRNPILAEAMRALGYVNRFGRGVIRAQGALQSNGSPPAEFSFDHNFVRVKILDPR